MNFSVFENKKLQLKSKQELRFGNFFTVSSYEFFFSFMISPKSIMKIVFSNLGDKSTKD